MKPLLTLVTCAFIIVIAGSAALAVEYKTAPGGDPVAPTITSPRQINQVPHPIESDKPQRKYHKDPMEQPDEQLEVPVYDATNPSHLQDSFFTSDAQRGAQLTACESFVGIFDTGWNPPDPDIAVGPDHVVEVVNSSIAIFDKHTGQKLMQSTAGFWFQSTSPPPPSGFIFDPKVVYDPIAERFIIFFLCTDDVSKSSYLVSVSASSDAMGSWYSYNFDATLNGTTPTSTWPDYPGLGFDYDEAVYLSSNQWLFNAGYIYAKVRILPKAQLYAGLSVNYNDVWDFRYNNNSVAFTVKPASTYSDAGGEFLMSNIWYGSNYTTYWKITSPLINPVVTLQPQVNVPSYPSPPSAAQLSGSAVGTIGSMTQEVVYRNGYLYTAFDQSFNWGSGTVCAVRVLGVDTVSSTATIDYVFGADAKHYYFPAVYVDPDDKVYLVCNRSASDEYISVHYVEDLANNTSSVVLKAGDGPKGGSAPVRWGDYAGISPDGVDQTKAWVCLEYPSSSLNSWSTWIGQAPSQLSAPSLVNPTDESTVNLPAMLEWNEITAAQLYELQVSDDPGFGTLIVDGLTPDLSYSASTLPDQTTYFWRVRPDGCPNNPWSPTWEFRVCDFIAGDANADGSLSVSDAVFIVNYIFSGGPTPNPIESGDLNCDTTVTIADCVYVLNFVFGGGPDPCLGC